MTSKINKDSKSRKGCKGCKGTTNDMRNQSNIGKASKSCKGSSQIPLGFISASTVVLDLLQVYTSCIWEVGSTAVKQRYVNSNWWELGMSLQLQCSTTHDWIPTIIVSVRDTRVSFQLVPLSNLLYSTPTRVEVELGGCALFYSVRFGVLRIEGEPRLARLNGRYQLWHPTPP